MNFSNITFKLFFVFVISYSASLSASEKDRQSEAESISDAKSVVKSIFQAANNMQFLKGLDYYSDERDTYFVNNGTIYSLDDLKESYALAGANLETIHNEILKWNYKVLGKDLIAFTLPVKLRLKFRDSSEYTGKLIWSAILQRTKTGWVVVQSHESWLNAAEVQKALVAD